MHSTQGQIDLALSQIIRALTREDMGVSADPDVPTITTTGGWILFHLAEAGAQRPGLLAEWQSVDKSTMTMQLRRLTKDGLVERLPDPDDRRAVLMQITQAGRQALETHRKRGRTLLSNRLAEWSDDELEALASALKKLAKSLQKGEADTAASDRLDKLD